MRYLIIFLFLLIGCDDGHDSSGGVDGGAGAGGVGGAGGAGGGDGNVFADRLAACGFAERFVASTVTVDGEDCTGTAPGEGDLVYLDHATAVIRYGDVAAAVVDVDADCGVRALTCSGEADAGDYDEITITVTGDALRVERLLVSNGRRIDCAPTTARLAAPGCMIDGRYTVAAAALSSGMCDHAWAAGTLEIEPIGTDGDRTVNWIEDGRDAARFGGFVDSEDTAACTFEASAINEFDGAIRTQTVAASIDGDAMMLTITESHDGPDANGALCPNATFTAVATRVAPSAIPGSTQCEPPDAICGDGVCVAGLEDCQTCPDDCGCVDGACERIGPTAFCGTPCVNGACGAGERCLVEFDEFVGPTCLPDAGETPPGGACDSSLDCQSGFVCSCTYGWDCPGVCVEACVDGCDRCNRTSWGTELCERDCSPANPDVCGVGGSCQTRTIDSTCVRLGDAPWVCHPLENAHTCGPGEAPAFGDPCVGERLCAVGLECVGTVCAEEAAGVRCTLRQCSRPCDDDGDCDAPLARCWRDEDFGVGYCIPD